MRLCILLGVVVGLLSACHLSEPHDELGLEASPQTIVNGDEISSDPYIVELHGQSLCSGTLVTKRTVVTAAHCTHGIPPERFSVLFGNRATENRIAVAVDAVLTHPNFVPKTRDNENTRFVGNDIGLLHLAEDAPVAPVPMSDTRLDLTGQIARVVGFGETEKGKGDTGVKRETTSKIVKSDDYFYYLEPEPGLTCHGDSGGPLFVEQFGRQFLAGINTLSSCYLVRTYEPPVIGISEGGWMEAVARDERLDQHLANFVLPFIREQEGDEAVCAQGDYFCNTQCADYGLPPDSDCATPDVYSGCSTASTMNLAGLGLALLAIALHRLKKSQRLSVRPRS